jgi:hypothetical protein
MSEEKSVKAIINGKEIPLKFNPESNIYEATKSIPYTTQLYELSDGSYIGIGSDDTFWHYTFQSNSTKAYFTGVVASEASCFPLYEVMSVLHEHGQVVGDLVLVNAIQINRDDYLKYRNI